MQQISVTDDYTIVEHEEIKRWAEKAKDINREESYDSKFSWRVHGNPKNGLHPTRILKREQNIHNY